MTWTSSARLYYHTARHLRPSQIAWRVQHMLLGRWRRMVEAPKDLQFERFTPPSVSLDALLVRANGADCLKSASSTLRGEFEFLNRSVSFPGPVDWKTDKEDLLWRFHLNSFEFGYALAVASRVTEETRFYLRFKELVRDWLAANGKQADDAWHPYPTSLRIVNWILSYLLMQDRFAQDAAFQDEFFRSLFVQSLWLSRHIELDLRGNHLFENARALFLSSQFFRNVRAVSWADAARRLLVQQLKEQILSDGAHFERSPMYHCAVLLGVLDCRLFAADAGSELRSLLEATARSMVSFLGEILYDDGSFPLLNDSVTNMVVGPSILLAYAETVLREPSARPTPPPDGLQLSARLLPASGLAILEGNGIRIVADGGKIGPDYQPGHGHCDTLSYELRNRGSSMVVDSGVFSYVDPDMRRYCRSTEAHNTVRVDREEQSEFWGAFRVGRRARPKSVTTQTGDSWVAFDGQHSGYERLRGSVVHRRRIVLLRMPAVVVFDELTGRGKHTVESFLHFHPDLRLEVRNQGAQVLGASSEISILVFGSVLASSHKGWFCPQFGRREENAVLALSGYMQLPTCFGYVLFFDSPSPEAANVTLEDVSRGHVLRIGRSGERHTLRFSNAESVSCGGESD